METSQKTFQLNSLYISSFFRHATSPTLLIILELNIPIMLDEKNKSWSYSLFYALLFLFSLLFLHSHPPPNARQLTSWASALVHHAIQLTVSRYDHSLRYTLETGFAKGGLPTSPVCPEDMHHIPWQKAIQDLQQPFYDPACLKCLSFLIDKHVFQSSCDNGESQYREQLQVWHCCDMLGTSETANINSTNYSQLSANQTKT